MWLFSSSSLFHLILLASCLRFCWPCAFLLHFTEVLLSCVFGKAKQINSHRNAILGHRGNNALVSHRWRMRPLSRLHSHQSAVWVQSGSLGMLKWWSELSDLQTLMCLQQLCPQRAGWGAVCGAETLLSWQFWDPWLELFIFTLFRNKGLNTRAADCHYSANVPSPSRWEREVHTPLHV